MPPAKSPVAATTRAVFFAAAVTVFAAMPLLAASSRFPVTDTMLSCFRSFTASEAIPPKFFSLTLAPAATDTILACTFAVPSILSAVIFLLSVISELKELVTLPTATAAPADALFPSDTSTATLTIVLPEATFSFFLVSGLRYPVPSASTLRFCRYVTYRFFDLPSASVAEIS